MEETQKNEQHQTKHVVQSGHEESTLTLKKSTLWKVGTFLFLGLFIISLLTGGFGLKSPTGQVIDNTGNNVVPSPSGNVKVSITDADPLLGDKKAKITI